MKPPSFIWAGTFVSSLPKSRSGDKVIFGKSTMAAQNY